jgi:glycosyltransferase involved in cell wall biosynthesis
VLFLGRINWKKGLDRLVAAMASVDARLVIAGHDDEGYAATLPRSERVTFAGEVAGEEKERLLASATMLVLPSLSENFGNVVLEALMMETPVAVTPGVGLAPDVAAADAGIVTDDFTSLAALLDDEPRRTAMGRNGRALVESAFTWPAIAARMEEAYCSMTSRR